MGMFRCEQDGHDGTTLCCDHVHAACKAAEPISFTWIDVGWASIPACAACAATVPTEASEDEMFEWPCERELKLVCGACFSAWERRTAGLPGA
jgi:hypothetical protein